MGCQACKNPDNTESQTLIEILKCIQAENISNLTFFLKKHIRSSTEHREVLMNEHIILVGTYKLNFLSYALLSGSVKSFRYLYEKCGCSIELMNQNFSAYGMSPLNIICEKNHPGLLKYFLPLFFRYRKESISIVDTTLDLTNNIVVKEPQEPYTAMQLAVLNDCITSVDILYTYSLTQPDPILSLEEINEETGENCALISVRSGSLAMVKLLYEKYNLDFTVKNKFGETALQICAVSSSKNLNLSFNEIFYYLIEEVRLDPTVNCEEVLLVLDKYEIISFYEKTLKKVGIEIGKKEVEDNFVSRKREEEVETRRVDRVRDRMGTSFMSSIEKVSFETPTSETSFAAHKGWIAGGK